ncbi:MAG: L-threonylcarbamoyladenylate synthase [Verrucomicrobiia bacterium]|jgi:L-threonylcarbamoyladenylate synthase
MVEKTKEAKILPAFTEEEIEKAVNEAVALLKNGDVVALPTETVYGLAANALNCDAVEKIFKIKGRPSTNPIIVHISNIEMAKHCVKEWNEAAQRLANNFWPGPLTIVLFKSEIIPPIVTAGGDTVGIRFPSHPVIQRVIERCGFPLAAPSANISNRVSPTTARHVFKQLGNKIKLIVDGGPCSVGIESTVFDLTSKPPRVLRPGIIHEDSIRAVLSGLKLHQTIHLKKDSRILMSPGLLKKHYSPVAKLICLSWQSEEELKQRLLSLGCKPETTWILAYSNPPSKLGNVTLMPKQAQSYAKALYCELHRCDEAGAKWIIVQTPPQTLEWRAIHDRLARASAE